LDDAPELLDGPLDQATLAGNLRDLARVNRFMGGAALSWNALERYLCPSEDPGRPVRLLDVGAGAADIPIEIARRAATCDRPVEIVATDVRPEIVHLARQRVTETDVNGVSVTLAESGPFDADDSSFDVVHSSMVLHHLEPPAAVRMLAEMGRVASRAVVVNDLDRGQHWWLGARLLSMLTTGNAYTRHDGPLSVRRAYRPNEVRQLAGAAGLVEEALYWTRPAYRFAFVFRRR